MLLEYIHLFLFHRRVCDDKPKYKDKIQPSPQKYKDAEKRKDDLSEGKDEPSEAEPSTSETKAKPRQEKKD